MRLQLSLTDGTLNVEIDKEIRGLGPWEDPNNVQVWRELQEAILTTYRGFYGENPHMLKDSE